MTPFRLLCVLAMWFMCTAAASAQGKIWVALVKADGDGISEDVRLQKLEPRLKPIVGFKSYHLIHEAQVPLGEKYAQWVLPRKDFYIKLEPVGDRANASGTVMFELYQHKKLLVTGKYKPTAGRPLFICGPDYQDGRLVFLLQLVGEKPEAGMREWRGGYCMMAPFRLH